MFAVIETGGKQYTVAPERTVQIEKVKGSKGDKVTFDKVLLLANGSNLKLGRPYVKGVTVTGTIVDQGKGKKIDVFKYKAKSRYRRSSGHRQLYSAVKIESIAA